MVNSFQGTPTQSDVIDKSISHALDHVHTCLPGSVITFDSKQRAQIKVGLKRMVGDSVIEYPPCINVPVIFGGTQQWSVFHEVKEGDEGILVFSERAADSWKQQGGTQSPFDCRSFSMSDAYFIPGARPDTQAFPALPNSGIGMTSKSNDVQLHLKESEAFMHKGQTSVSLTDSSAVVKRGAVSATLTDQAITTTIGASSITSTAEAVTIVAGGQTLIIGPAGIIHNGVNIGATHVHSQKPDFGGDKQNDTEVPH